MGRLSRAAAARVALRLLPAERRDWVRAVWAESYEVPSGHRRPAWLAGGLPAIAMGALMAGRIGRWLLDETILILPCRAGAPASCCYLP